MISVWWVWGWSHRSHSTSPIPVISGSRSLPSCRIPPRVFRWSNLAPGTKPTYYVQANGFEGNELTNDADHYAYFRAQLANNPELGLGGPTIHWAVLAVNEVDALKVSPAPETPMLVFLGTEEDVVDATAIKSRVPTIPNGTLELLSGSKHEVWMETPEIQTQVWDITDKFLAKIS